MENGRQLATANASGKDLSYTYDVDGIRTSKTVNGVTHSYTTLNGQVVRETWTENGKTKTLDILTDDESKPFALVYNDGTKTETYYYVLNQQGDVIRLVDGNGATYANYSYNAWGEPVRVYLDNGSEITAADHIANLNPIRYRGYYYDTETGFYYVGSRYYDPVLCRFVSADSADLIRTNQNTLTDKNFFVYCDNNPVMHSDNDGELWHLAVGAVVGVASQIMSDVIFNQKSSLADYGAAALSGALAASSIGAIGSTIANAAIGGVTYLANCDKQGEKINGKDFGLSVAIGAISGIAGGSGANGAKLRGIVKTSKSVLKTAVSPKKIAMYTAKIVKVRKTVVKAVFFTKFSSFLSNGLNIIRRDRTRSRA